MVTKKRSMTEKCAINSITQGSIFNYALNEYFESDLNLGMIISARCDVSNGKGDHYSYLPVVTLCDFYKKIIHPKLIDNKINNEINTIKDVIKSENSESELLHVYGIEKTINTLITKPKNKDKANVCFQNITRLENIKKTDYKILTKDDLNEVNEKSVKKELDNVIENKVEGYFLIDEVIDFNDKERLLGPHVVLLREVHHISSAVVEAVKKGILHNDLRKISGAEKSIQLTDDNFSYVLCNIKSPFIELIMQRFSILFTRIGVADPDLNLSSSLINTYVLEK